VVKDTFVYSNKGFKRFAQAQLLADEICYTDAAETPQWLTYYISKPLVGQADPASIPSAPSFKAIPTPPLTAPKLPALATALQQPSGDAVKTLNDLLNRFPTIARNMQPGLEKLFQEFTADVAKGTPVQTPASGQEGEEPDDRLERTSSAVSTSSRASSFMGRTLTRTATVLDAEENHLRGLAETLVMSAIDIFQSVDKQYLAALAAATNLSGPVIERMIERYVIEHVHDTILFPKVCSVMSHEDKELEANLRSMKDVDIAQVGIADGDKGDHSRRILAGIEAFKKMGVAGSPMEMCEILLQTERCLAVGAVEPTQAHRNSVSSEISTASKVPAVVATNADTLVSLLLMVVIRAPIRHLHARLVYMRDFAFIEDVESGELGYALSTFEGVLSYLSSNSRGLRRVSRTNRSLWQAVKQGNLKAVRKALEPGFDGEDSAADDTVSPADTESSNCRVTFSDDHMNPLEVFTSPTEEATLAHVFPWNDTEIRANGVKPKIKKRVSMSRTISNSSVSSSRSRSSTIGSIITVNSAMSAINEDISPQQLCQATNEAGHSLLMMAIEHDQKHILDYLLTLEELITKEQVLADSDNELITLLSAAVQAGKKSIVHSLLSYILRNASGTSLTSYLRRTDVKGRCVAHYVSDAPYLISELGELLPWKLKDNTGQTPLFALCRSYDVESYFELVDTAITAAVQSQKGDALLHLDDHVDKKGNTLLHLVTDPKLIQRLSYRTDADPNACNDKHFTPLMVASKFARTDVVRMLFGDERVDLQARDFRGLTAIDLAKDDEVRNRIDDMGLLLMIPSAEDQKTTVVRSFFVEDGSIRLVIKSGSRNINNTITVTTSRRSLLDFENLAQWLALEHPASYIPSVFNARSPFQIPSKPSRQMLRDLQLRLNNFLQTLFAHSTFRTHEMLWEFVLVPDIDPSMLADRAHRKAQLRLEKLREDYDPLLQRDEVRDIEHFVQHARQQILAVHNAYRAVFRCTASIRTILADISEAHHLNAQEAARSIGSFIPQPYINALSRFAKTYAQMEWSPTTQLQYSILGTVSATSALLTSYSRPSHLIRALRSAQAEFNKHASAVALSNSSPTKSVNPATRFLALLDDTARTSKRDQESREKAEVAGKELRHLGCELRYTQETIAGELAGWQESHAKGVRKALRDLARRSVVVERERLAGLRRVGRELRVGMGLED